MLKCCTAPYEVAGRNGLAIGSSVSDAAVPSWLELAASGSCSLDYFSSVTEVVDNRPYKQ